MKLLKDEKGLKSREKHSFSVTQKINNFPVSTISKDSILKYALQNAVKFNGKANPGAVIGKLIAEDPKVKDKLKEIGKDIQKAIKEANSMKLDEQISKLKKIAPELLEEKPKEEKKGLKPLRNVKGKVIMRFAPSPSGPMHVGHAYGISLSSEYCRIYKGKFIFRIEDTNPENIYPPAYEILVDDAKWITKDNIAELITQSDRLGVYYDYAEKLIDMGKAYICTCDPDKFKEMLFEKKACACRDLNVKEQHKRYDMMFSSYKPGEAVMRLKTDIEHKNPAMRDFPLMRINDHVHPKQKNEFRVWPLMNFAVFVDDAESGMTHIIRAKEHMDNAKKQEFLYNYFDKPIPETMFVGRMNFTDLRISCSKTKALIEENKYTGWDDIRLPFLLALKRRGYQPDAFINWAVSIGVSQTDKTVSKDEFFKSLDSFNREVIEPIAHRYFFINEPVEIIISNAPKQKIELDLHPENKKKGRKFNTADKFFITKKDLNEIKSNELIRLMDCLNFKKVKKGFEFISTSYEEYKEKGKKIVHWLPVGDAVNVEVVMDDASVVKGFGEKGLEKLKEGDIVQLERFGFCRLDKKEKDKLVFWFTHK